MSQLKATALDKGALGPENTSTKELMWAAFGLTSALAYSEQKPGGYSLSNPVAKEVTLPFLTLGFHARWFFPLTFPMN